MPVNMDLGGSKPAQEETPSEEQNAQKEMAPIKGATNTPSFMMTGQKAQEALKKEEAVAKQRQEEGQQLWRFMIPQNNLGTDYVVTFLDGDLGPDGLLAVPTWAEHTIQLSGKWSNYPCVGHAEPCPMCENGSKSNLVAGFTVIDHTPYTIKKGPNAGKTIEKSKKLYIAKRSTFGILQKRATKEGGLAGLSLEISRTTDKSPNVGDIFDVVGKKSLEDLTAQLVAAGFPKEITVPADWAKEITYRDRDTLAGLGIVGSLAMVGGSAPKGSNLQNEL